MVDCRVERRDIDGAVVWHQPLAQHAASMVVLDERELGESIDVRERLTEGAERRLDVVGDRERVSERRESARRHGRKM